MLWLPALVTTALVLAAGSSWFSLLELGTARGTEWLGHSIALGVSWLCIVAVVLGASGSNAGFGASCIALCVPIGAALLARRTRSAGESDRSARATVLGEWLGLLPALCVVALSLWLACQRPVWNIDAEKRWVLHGQWIAKYHTALPDAVRDPIWTTTCPTYPPLVPALVSVALGAGADRDMGARPLFPLFFLALLTTLHGYACRTAGPKHARWITLAFALTPCFAYLDRWGDALGLGADAAMADIPLATLLTVGAVLLLRMIEAREPDRGRVAASCLVLAGATLTKQEGSVSALALLAVAAIGLPLLRERGERAAIVRALCLCGVTVVLAAGAWSLLSQGMPVEAGHDYVSADAARSLLARLERLPIVLPRLAGELGRWRTWGPLWFLPVFALGTSLCSYAKERSAHHLLPSLTAAWLASGIALAAGSYLVTGWKGGNFAYLMEVSLTRLLMHHAPLVAIMIAQCVTRRARAASD
jgi:hypothetical protein